MIAETAYYLGMRAASRISELRRHRQFYSAVLNDDDKRFLNMEYDVLFDEMNYYLKILGDHVRRDPVQADLWINTVRRKADQ